MNELKLQHGLVVWQHQSLQRVWPAVLISRAYPRSQTWQLRHSGTNKKYPQVAESLILDFFLNFYLIGVLKGDLGRQVPSACEDACRRMRMENISSQHVQLQVSGYEIIIQALLVFETTKAQGSVEL